MEKLDIAGIQSAVSGIQAKIASFEEFSTQLNSLASGISAGWDSTNSEAFIATAKDVAESVRLLKEGISGVATKCGAYNQSMDSADKTASSAQV